MPLDSKGFRVAGNARDGFKIRQHRTDSGFRVKGTLLDKQYVDLGRDIEIGVPLIIETPDTHVELTLIPASKVGDLQVEWVSFRTRGLNSDWRNPKLFTVPRFILIGDEFRVNPTRRPGNWEEITGMQLNGKKMF